MYEIVDVTGFPGGECYLILSERTAVLIDSGFGFSAANTADSIQSALDGRELSYILLTHSHYDHAFGSSVITKRFPTAKVVCSEYAARIFSKPSAYELMCSLDESAALGAGFAACEAAPPRADVVLADGQELDIPGMPVRAICTPGHTRCAMSYYFPEDGLLATSETTGIAPDYPRIEPEFIVGYQMTLDAINRLKALNPSRILASHTGVFSGVEAESFFDLSRKAAMDVASFILERYDRKDSINEIIRAYHQAYFQGKVKETQPERAFLLNAEAMIPRLLREMGRELPEDSVTT